MANALFTAFKSFQLGDAAISGFSVVDFEANTIKVTLIDSADDTFTPTGTTDQDYADVASGARVGVGTLGTKTVTNSGGTVTFDAADTTLTAVTGDQSEVLLIWKDTTVEATSPLIVYFDTFSSGMPVTPNGGDIVIQWNASGIFTW